MKPSTLWDGIDAPACTIKRTVSNRSDLTRAEVFMAAKLAPCDLVLVEGFKSSALPKIEVWRAENGKPLLQPEDPWIVAIACDTALPHAKVPVIDLNDIDAIAELLLAKAVPVREIKARADAV